jgi:hypothetical protein
VRETWEAAKDANAEEDAEAEAAASSKAPGGKANAARQPEAKADEAPKGLKDNLGAAVLASYNARVAVERGEIASAKK